MKLKNKICHTMYKYGLSSILLRHKQIMQSPVIDDVYIMGNTQ